MGRGQPLGLKGRGPTRTSSTGANGSAGDPWKQGADIGFAIFDPWEQGKQYDKSEAYVRRWVPELRCVPDGYAHQPHLLTPSQQRRAGCNDYPTPLAFEPFKYPTGVDQEGSTAKWKHRRVEQDTSIASRTAVKKDGYDSASYSNARWQGWQESKTSQYPSERNNGRRWQAKANSARVVYMKN